MIDLRPRAGIHSVEPLAPAVYNASEIISNDDDDDQYMTSMSNKRRFVGAD